MTNRSVASALLFLCTLGVAGQASAHAHLKTSLPADKSTVASAPSAVTMTFTESLNLKFSGIKLIGPEKAAVKTGDASLSDEDKGLTVPVAGPLAAGPYTVEWHVLSSDGHKTSGSFSFTVKP